MASVASPLRARVTLRRGKPGDARALTGIALAAKRDWGYPARWIREWTPQLTITPTYLREHAVFVASVAGRPRAFCALLREPRRWVLDHLWVHPDAMGIGIGRRLFERARAHAAAEGPRTLRIEADPNAVGFYEHMGARRAGSVAAPVAGVARRLPVLRLAL